MDSTRILIIDDDALESLSLQRLVESMGHICVGISREAEHAITLASVERPEIALIDINIEGVVDGVDTAEILYNKFGIHVIFITAYSDEATLLRVKSSHPFGYILKPYTDKNIKVALTIALYQIDLERSLREKDEQLKVALAATKIGIWRFNPVKKDVFFDASASSIMGLHPGEQHLSGSEMVFLIHKDDYPHFMEEYERSLRERSQFEIDIRIVRKNNEVRWVRNRGVCSVNALDGEPYLTGSIVDITDRKLLEDKFLNIYEANRQEMGQQIHDELGQQLTGLTLLAESLLASLEDRSQNEDAERARKIAHRAYSALEDVRRIARNFYPVQITPQGFEDAIVSLASDAEALAGIPCSVENRAGPIRFNNAQATQIYYIIREAINNAIKHSHATNIRIRISRMEETLHISVSDNGVGIPVDNPRKGLGMNIMEFRAGMSKGTLRVSSGENGGSEILITVRDNIEPKEYQEFTMENAIR